MVAGMHLSSLERGEGLPCPQGSCHPTQAWDFPPYDIPGKGWAEAATVLKGSRAPLCLEVLLIPDSARRGPVLPTISTHLPLVRPGSSTCRSG